MPKRTDIKTILILGAGPIVIGQACEFDYSGTQACYALRAEGYRVVLVNSNPATIMTDPDTADAVYIEPIQWDIVERIIAIERPDALLPTMGGQTALNCALALAEHGVLEKYNVELIGANREAIDKAEDRQKFRAAMQSIGMDMPRSAIVHTLDEALDAIHDIGYPAIIRPSFTLGGSGGGIAYNREEYIEICKGGLDASPTRELLIDESIIGWKEFELEVVRDRADNCIIVCAIENVDPMGVHTGDSITVAPAQTLTDQEYQRLRNAAIKILREIGVDTGGSNVQFGLDPVTGRLVVIEMNPRVSRSSALASKATGFPIAKIAAKLAIGYTLDELQNEITDGLIPAAFEPTLDYVVIKIPRFNFDKFPQAENRLTTQMKSVGEVMAIGRTFQEALQKAMRSLESGFDGFNPILDMSNPEAMTLLRGKLQVPSSDRLWYIGDAFRMGLSLADIQNYTKMDPWFLSQIEEIIACEQQLQGCSLADIGTEDLTYYKRKGFSDRRLASLLDTTEAKIRHTRQAAGIRPVYKRIDTCAAEFPTNTAYLYSTYEEYCEALPESRKKIMILGSGPNRIGQGIEFDYCCVHAAMAIRAAGYDAIMVNCNPETVSTDFQISNRLYFEPITAEDVLEIIDVEKPDGVIVHFGGQTPLKLARILEANGVPIIGTSPDAIDRAEDRERFGEMIKQLNLLQPPNGTVRTEKEALKLAEKIGYPLVVRPSYVLGGRAMEIVHTPEDLQHYLATAVKVSYDCPVLLDHYLNDAIELDVDAVCDGQDVLIGGIMEHIEEAGIHSGDSACTLPPFSISVVLQEELKQQMRLMALELGVVGLLNAQFAIQSDDIYVLEVNPRASRTVPFVSKAIGVPLAQIATRCMLGESLASQNIREVVPNFYSIKLPVFPFTKFAGVDCILGPEMKSTGEVMGIAKRFGQAYAKALIASGTNILLRRKVFVSVRDDDKLHIPAIAKRLVDLGFEVLATNGTARAIKAAAIPCSRVNKMLEGRPHIVDMIKNGEIDFIVNTTDGKQALADSFVIRNSALANKVSYTTTIAGAKAACLAMKYEDRTGVSKLSDLHKG